MPDAVQEHGVPNSVTGFMSATPAAKISFTVCLMFAVWSAVHLTARTLGWNLYGQPILTLDQSVLDLGQVTAGQVIAVNVPIRNTGRRPLMISNVRGSCDTCLKIRSFPRAPIDPGDAANLEIEVSVGSNPGRTQKQVLVFSNDRTGRPIAVKLQWDLPKT